MLKRIFILLVFPLILAACKPAAQQPAGPQYGSESAPKVRHVYRLAAHPLYNPAKLTELFQPLLDYLGSHIEGTEFVLEASRDYAAFEEKFRKREAEFLLPNPWQTLEAMKVGYRVIVMTGSVSEFKGIFLVRRDSPIRNVQDVKGKIVSYPAPTALAATLMPQYFLYQNGIDVNRDIDNRYVGSQESSIMHVYTKQSDIGATWPTPWRVFQRENPLEAAQMKVIWETPALANNSFMVRDDVAPDIRDRVRELLKDLHTSEAGRAILESMGTTRFHFATDADYAPVREFIRRFEREVRPVEIKK